MKLLLKQPFSLEIPHENEDDEIITGTLSPLSKKQLKDFKDAFKKDQALSDKVRKLQRKLLRLKSTDTKRYDLEDEIRDLNVELLSMDTEESTSKLRFELSVISEQKERMIEISDLISYQEMLSTIVKDIEDKKGNVIPA
jgi:hypothetical protein